MSTSIVMQFIINGQSLVSGFVANFRLYNIGALALICYWLVKYKISMQHLVKGLITAGWINLSIIILIYVTDFTFTSASELTGEIHYTHAGILKKTLIDLVAIIYLVFYFHNNKYKYLILAIFFFSVHHLYDLQRFALLMQIFIIFIAFMKTHNFRAKKSFLIPALIIIFSCTIFLFNSQPGQNTINRFSQSFMIFSDDSKITDTSTQARILEAVIALEHFNKSPYFGNGLYRESEKEAIFGDDYFYLSDIGLFGVLYTFGILGLLVIIFQYKFLYKSMDYINLNIWSGVGVLSMLYLLLNTLLTGKSILSFSFFLFCVLFIEFSKLEGKNKIL